MKKKLLLILLSMIFVFSSFVSNAETIIKKPEYLKLIYKKYYEDRIDFNKMTKVEALLILEYADSVDNHSTGYSGSVSLQRYAYYLLAGEPFTNWNLYVPNGYSFSNELESEKNKESKKSEKFLTSLFLNAKTNEGKVYALMGLSTINLELYEKYYEQMDLEDSISTLSGCLGNSKKIGDFLKKPKKNENIDGISGFSWF